MKTTTTKSIFNGDHCRSLQPTAKQMRRKNRTRMSNLQI